MFRGITYVLVLWLGIGCVEVYAQESFTVATYNLAGYLDQLVQNRRLKSEEAKTAIQDTILIARPDVLVVQEMGKWSALKELQSSLARRGVNYRHLRMVHGYDPYIHVGLLSRFPVVREHYHTNDVFLLEGKRMEVSRGFLEAEIRVTANYRFTLFAAHLKSKRSVIYGDEAMIRAREAELLRAKIDAVFERDAKANLLVLGDLNDTRDSRPIRTIIGRGAWSLKDTRPNESSGVNGSPRRHTNWTYYFDRKDAYTRVDYILLSRGMAAEWDAESSFVLATPDWIDASDHRLVRVTFETTDR
jgi:endonuclease/exonuclease/phosphatase family metal-dependent hydrolase